MDSTPQLKRPKPVEDNLESLEQALSNLARCFKRFKRRVEGLEDDSDNEDLEQAIIPNTNEQQLAENEHEGSEQTGGPLPGSRIMVVLPSRSPVSIHCDVCLETMEEGDYPERVTPACDHDPRICTSCLIESIEQDLSDVSWDKIQCPLCPEMVPFESVKKYLSVEALERYDRQLVLASLQHESSFRYCVQPDCGSGQIHLDEDEEPMVTCTERESESCFFHQVPWHYDMTCSEYDEELAEDSEKVKQETDSKEFLAKKTKACPNPACGIRCTKIYGCDHMTCDVCGSEFCWRCLVLYSLRLEDGSVAHKNDCPWHSTQLEMDGEPDPDEEIESGTEEDSEEEV